MRTTHQSFIVYAIFSIALCAVSTWAKAQDSVKNAPRASAGSSTVAPAACPAASEMKASQLFGSWRATFANPPAGLPASATVLLKRHAEFSDSLSGVVSRDFGAAAGSPTVAGHAAKAFLAGDLDGGLLLLDESSDNIAITGTWNGDMAAGSCGKVFTGLWKDTSKSARDDAPDVPFKLIKLP